MDTGWGAPASSNQLCEPEAAAGAEVVLEAAEDGSSSDDVAPYPLPGDSASESDSDAEEAAPAPSGGNGGGPLTAARSPEQPFVPCSTVFEDAEELYAFLLLRGSKHLTEELYSMVRAGFNNSANVRLPSLTYMRQQVVPAAASWMLPMARMEAPVSGGPSTATVRYILPSSHVRRDMAFSGTYDLFFSAERRSAADRELEPEFIDSPFFTDRRTHLLSGATVRLFNLDGERISVGDTIEVVFGGDLPDVRVVVADAHFCSHESGVSNDEELHAGDFVLIGSGEHSGTLVARQWQSSTLPVLTWFPDADDNATQVAKEVRVVATGPGAAPVPPVVGPAAAASSGAPRRRPTYGIRNGERYLVVSFCFSSDDFEARRGRSASLGGVYFSYLTWMYEERRNSGASRTVAATPPGVDSDHVLRAITPDLVRGARDGWLCRAPDGSHVRVFADVSMYVGDYLQVTKTSMMMGYSAKSPCPLCDYRIPGIPGSKYGHIGSSADVGMARTTPRTNSICIAVGSALAHTG